MNGDDPETQPASPPGGEHTGPMPVSSGDFPTLTPQPIVNSRTALIGARQPLASTKPADIVPVRRKIGKYSLVKEIGRGGMGVVYLAHQDDLNREVALKVIPSGPDADRTEVARFRAEAETAANLHHPNIVPVYDVGTADELSYLAMEYIDGGSLYKLISRKPLEPMLAARLLEPVCRGMHYAHQQGVIHRDLKPSNILLTNAEHKTNADFDPTEDHPATTLVPMITDFGLAKRIHRPLALTQTGLAVGTPHYMAPEQAMGKAELISPLTDVYALGAILYEMLTGHPPFGAGSSLETMQQVVSKKPVPPSNLRASVPRELEHICLRCLEKKPAARYPSALAVAEALHGYIHRTEPPTILARAPSGPTSSASLVVRQLSAWYFWPAALLVGVLLTAFLTWRITHRNWLPVQHDLLAKIEETDRTAAFLKFENAILLADRGDFERLAALDPAQLGEYAGIMSEYRRRELTPAPWDRTIRARKVAFDHTGKYLLALLDNQFLTIKADTGEVVNTRRLAEPESGPRDTQAGYVIGRSQAGSLFAVVADPTKLEMGNAPHYPLIEASAVLPAAARLIQPLADGSAILLSDGTDRWTIDIKGRKPTPVPASATDPKFSKTLAISEQGKWLVESENGWHVLPAAKGESVIPVPGSVDEVMFSPSGTYLLAILRNGAARLFDFNEHRWFDLPADGIVTAAGFSADGNIIAVGTRAGTVRLWDALARVRLSGAANLNLRIIAVDISNDRQTVVALTADRTVHRLRFSATPFYSPTMRLENKPLKDVVDIGFSSNGGSLYVTTPHSLSRWNVRTAVRQQFAGEHEVPPTEKMMTSTRPKRRTPEFKAMTVRAPSGTENGEQVLVGGVDGKMALLAVKPDGVTPQTQTEVEGGENVTGLAITHDGEKTVAVCDSESPGETFVKYWNTRLGTETGGRKKSTRFPFHITAECFTPNGQQIALGTDDGFVRLWDPDKPPDEFVREFKCDSRVICVTIDRDGELLLAGCADGQARVFEMRSGNLLRSLKHRTEVRKAVFHKDRPVTAAADGAIRVWHPQHEFTLGPPFRHGDAITAMSIRGDLLAVASRDRTIRVWNLPSSEFGIRNSE